MYKDATVTTEFIEDYANAPPHVKKAVDKLLKMVSHGILPNGARVHKAEALGGLWIGYVTRTKSHWRVTFFVNDGIIEFDRLMSHDEMDIYLKYLQKVTP